LARKKQPQGQSPWDVVYFKTAHGKVPAVDFLDGCPSNVEAEILATLEAVRKAPPPRFSGGGRWEAMRGDMTGYFEVRTQGPKREQFRLFCLLENADQRELSRRGFKRPAIVAITGLRKPWMTTLGAGDYKKVRKLGDIHKSNFPRRIAT
jgi:hypothetical protein